MSVTTGILDPGDIGENIGKKLRIGVDNVDILPDVTKRLAPDWVNNIGERVSDKQFWQRAGVALLAVWLIYIGIMVILAQSRTVRGIAGTALAAGTKGVVNVPQEG